MIGHPENFLTPGVEVSTGPLGQGISNAVGIAMAEKHLAAIFNQNDFDIVDHYTYVLCGDGCLQEGVSSEASSLAGHLGLGKLIVCYDDNRITIDGDTSLSFTEDVLLRYQAYGWHVQTVDDVNDISALRNAISIAKTEVNRPSLIKVSILDNSVMSFDLTLYLSRFVLLLVLVQLKKVQKVFMVHLWELMTLNQ